MVDERTSITVIYIWLVYREHDEDATLKTTLCAGARTNRAINEKKKKQRVLSYISLP